MIRFRILHFVVLEKMKNSFIEGAISPEKIAISIAHHQHKTNIGGHSIFLGQVRADEIDQKVVKVIEFTTYRELAEQKIAAIREDIFAKYALTSSKHRKPAQQACDELVERIKAEVPIWGKEIFEDETHQWKENN